MIQDLLSRLRPSRWIGLRGFVLILAASCQDTSSGPHSGEPRQLWSLADPAGAGSMPFADADLAVFTTAFAPRIVAADAGSGSLRWSRALTGGPAGLTLPFANVLSDGNVLFVPAWDLYALTRTTGATRWVFSSPDEYTAGSDIARQDSTIVTPGSLRRIFAVHATTGAMLWQRDLQERPFTPIISGDVVFVGTRGEIGSSGVLGAGHAMALRLRDGALLWSAALPDAATGSWRGGTNRGGVLTKSAFIVASTNGRVYAFDRTSGTTMWSYDGPGPFESGVALLGNVAIVAAVTGDIIGLDAGTGRELWRRSTGGSSVVRQITADERWAYISVGGLICVDSTGVVTWEAGGASKNGPTFFTPANAVGGRLFIGSSAGLHAYSLAR